MSEHDSQTSSQTGSQTAPQDFPPGARLRELIQESGCTYESLIRYVRTVAHEAGDRQLNANRSSVAQWVAGSVPAPRTRAYLAEALSRRLGRRVTVTDLGFPDDENEDLGVVTTDVVNGVAA